jgi:hypothetical protein
MARPAPVENRLGVLATSQRVPGALPARHLGVRPESTSVHSLWRFPRERDAP